MKYLLTILALSSLLSCGGNESAPNRPSDLDRTNNNDTSAKNPNVNTTTLDSLDSVQQNQKQ